MAQKGVFSGILGKNNPMDSRTWFYNRARLLENPIRPRTILAEANKKENARSYVMPGRLYMFHYRAKYRETLPYYDRFPLVFPFSIRDDGFTGINMHYLPPVYRAVLMDNLLPFLIKGAPGDPIDQTRIQLSYELLKNASQLRYYKPAVKSYLNTHVISRFIIVPPNEWQMALMLPLESFTTKKINRVFKDSRKVIHGNGNSTTK